MAASVRTWWWDSAVGSAFRLRVGSRGRCPARAGRRKTDDEEAGLFRQVAREAQPAVAAMVGLPEGDPVDVTMMTRQDLEAFLISTVQIEYPDGELTTLGRCCAEVGLLPRGYDLTEGTIDLIREEAGAVYDPYSKSSAGSPGPAAGAEVAPRPREPSCLTSFVTRSKTV